MVTKIITVISSLIITVISKLGYAGVVFLMILESAAIPIPSEIIMPFTGFLVYQGRFNLWLAVLAGAVGNVIGSIILYYIGKYGGRPLILKYGRYILISHRDLDWAERWTTKYGSLGIFFSRVLPVIRTYISFPAGVVKMNIYKFIIYSFIGAFIWTLFLTYIGVTWGEHWEEIRVYFEKFDIFIGILIIAGIIWFIRRHLNHYKSHEHGNS
jgi:membrane protein DedA with SNARE-associated domain